MIANTKCCIYCMRELHWQTQTPDTRWGFRLFVGRSDPMTSSMSLGDPNRRTRPSNPFKRLRFFFRNKIFKLSFGEHRLGFLDKKVSIYRHYPCAYLVNRSTATYGTY